MARIEPECSPNVARFVDGWTDGWDGIGLEWLSYVVGSLRAPSVLIKSITIKHSTHI